MKPTEILGKARTPDGAVVTLTRNGDDHVIRIDGRNLMSSRMHGSEEALATAACARVRQQARPHVLVGGLGMGFTLRATLELLPADATVVVVELLPAVVLWNQSLLGELAGHPLSDPRVQVQIADVGATIHAATDAFDAIMLDVDNGPSALTSSANDGLYDTAGLLRARSALRPGGVLAVWSANDDRRFRQRLRAAGFTVEVQTVRGHLHKGPRHTIFVGYRG